MHCINRLWATAVLAASCLTLPSYVTAQSHVFDWVRAVQAYHTPALTSFNWAEQVTTDKNNNIYMTGQFIRSVDFNPGTGVDSQYSNNYGAYVSKFDAAGSYQWTLSVANATGKTVGFDQAGNIYMAGSMMGTADFDPGPGTYNLTSVGVEDFFLAKYDGNRNLLWAIRAGGSAGDIINSLQVDGNGNVYVTGWIHNSMLTPIDFDPKHPGTKTVQYTSVRDAFVAKYDPNGNCLWAHHINGQDGDGGQKLLLDASNNVYVGGYTAGCTFPGNAVPMASSNMSYDAFIVKYTSAGVYSWARLYGAAGWDHAYDMAMDTKGNLYLTGLFMGTTNYNPSNPATAHTSNGLADIFLLKVSNTGSYIWSRAFGSTQDDVGKAVATDNTDNVYLGGTMTGTVNFNPSGTAANYTSKGFTDMFLTKLNATGDFQWVKGYGSIGPDEITDIYVDGSTNVFFTGDVSRDTDFDPGTAGAQVTIVNPNPNHAQNSFMCKLTLKEEEPQSVGNIHTVSIQVYPNPVNDQLVITTKDDAVQATVTIADIAGRVYHLPTAVVRNSITINTTTLTPGVYMLLYSNPKTGTKEALRITKN